MSEQMTWAGLEVGETYRAVGPNPDRGGKWDPPQVKIVGATARGYVTEGARQPARLILYGCERFWLRV